MTPRLVALCALLAALALVPGTADVLQIDLPLWLRLALLPLAEGLHYTAVIVHEPGHALSHWLFGEPALPLLDVEHGGGMTYTAGRSAALMAFIYILMMAGVFLLWRRGRPRLAAALAAFVPVHAALVYSGLDSFVSLVMGQGMEIIAGGALLALAAARPDKLKTTPERAVALTLGLYFMARNILLSLSLMFSAARRLEYTDQKGITGLGDYARAGAIIGAPVEAVAAGMLVFLLAVLLAAAVYARRVRGGT